MSSFITKKMLSIEKEFIFVKKKFKIRLVFTFNDVVYQIGTFLLSQDKALYADILRKNVWQQ